MNLRKMMLTGAPASEPAVGVTPPSPVGAPTAEPHIPASVQGSNVIPLSAARFEQTDFRTSSTEGSADDAGAQMGRFKGLMNTPELVGFFGENYFAFGRHNGSRYRSLEALDIGRKALIAKFQNLLVDLAERRQTKHDRLQRQILDIEGLSAPLVAQLRMACDHLEREMSALRQQVDQAERHEGWVLEAVNHYQLGFDRGLREALDFDLLRS